MVATSKSYFLFTILILILVSLIAGSVAGWNSSVAPACRGKKVEECPMAREGMELGGMRRILATSTYISYDSLQRDSVPCSYKGQSYYNCQPGAVANPYSRGCTAITMCKK